MYVPTQLNYRVLNEVNVMNDLMESVFVDLFFADKRNVIIGVVYRLPQGNENLFINEMQAVLSWVNIMLIFFSTMRMHTSLFEHVYIFLFIDLSY